MALGVVISIDVLPDTSAPGRSTAFLVLTAFLLTFAFIRTSARLIRNPKVTWWPGNVETGDLHIHHLVWGICLRPGVRVPRLRRGPAEPVVAHLGDRLRDRRGPDHRRVRALAVPARRLLGPRGAAVGRRGGPGDDLRGARRARHEAVRARRPRLGPRDGPALPRGRRAVRARVPEGPLPHRRRRALRPLLGARGRRPPGQARARPGRGGATAGRARTSSPARSGASGPTAAPPSSATGSSPSRPASRSPSRPAAAPPDERG